MKNKKLIKEIKITLSVMDKFFAKRNIIFSTSGDFNVTKSKQQMAEAN